MVKAKIAVWILSEILLTIIGFDDLADMAEWTDTVHGKSFAVVAVVAKGKKLKPTDRGSGR